MKKIKLPLEMANGVMVRTIDELKENWDLTKVVEHFVSGKLVTWLNDRYYSDIAEKIENLPKDDGKKLQQALCKAFDMPCEDVELDVDEIAERKRRKDLLRQYTSEEKILDNVDHVAFNQEDLAYLLDDEIDEIYLFNNKFMLPLSVEDKKYIGIGDNVVVEIRSKKSVNFKERKIEFENVKFDDEYQAIHVVIPDKKVGDVIVLGEWHNEPIEWQVLDVKDGKALLLSKYAIDSKEYHPYCEEDITWEKCTLRQWLNGEFYNMALQSLPEGTVLDSNVPAHNNPEYSTAPGNDTKDKVFLLSVKEVLQYLKTDNERMCYPGPWVESKMADEETGTCWWWLRSPGESGGRAASVNYDGSVNNYGDGVDGDGSTNVVRPACWVDLSKLE